jgi:hypothetical protein
MVKRTYEVTVIEDKPFRIIVTSDNADEVGKYKCECSQIIKKVTSIPKHLQTKSHTNNMDWKRQNIPAGSLLRPEAK